MNALHPHVIKLGVIFHNAMVLDVTTSSNNQRMINLINRAEALGWKYGTDYKVVENFTVQTPCKLLPFNGQHVQHREFTSNYCGDYTATFYRWPGLVSTFDVVRWLRDNGIRYRETRCHHSYDCCANWYCDGVYVEHHKGHTIARIGWARNV